MARSMAPRRRYGDRRDDAAGKGEVSPSLTVDAREAGVEVMIYYAVSLLGGHGNVWSAPTSLRGRRGFTMYAHADPSFVLFQGALASLYAQRRGGM